MSIDLLRPRRSADPRLDRLNDRFVVSIEPMMRQRFARLAARVATVHGDECMVAAGRELLRRLELT